MFTVCLLGLNKGPDSMLIHVFWGPRWIKWSTSISCLNARKWGYEENVSVRHVPLAMKLFKLSGRLTQPAARYTSVCSLPFPVGQGEVRRGEEDFSIDIKTATYMKEKLHVNEKQNKEFLTTLYCQVTSGNQASVSVRVTLENKYLLFSFLWAFLAERVIVWYRIPHWSVWVSCPSCVLSWPLA